MIWRASIWSFWNQTLSVLLTLCLPVRLLAQTPANNELTTSKELQSLTRDQAAGGVHFHVKGTVLCYDEGWHQLYVHDG